MASDEIPICDGDMEEDKIPNCDVDPHDYVYDPHERRHYCKKCDQDPPLDWYDIFSD